MVGKEGQERVRILTRAEMESVVPKMDPKDVEAENQRQHLYAVAKNVGLLLPTPWKVEPDMRDGPALLFTHPASLEVLRVLAPLGTAKGCTAYSCAILTLRHFIEQLTEQILESEREGHGER